MPADADVDARPCPVCGARTQKIGEKKGAFRPMTFVLRRCGACRFAFVANPCTDYAALYDEAYYRGAGADSAVDYVTELESADLTVRGYEWQGLLKVVGALAGGLEGKRWLDFGCGNGGLVRAGRQAGLDVVGAEEGWIAERARGAGIPILTRSELDARAGQFQVVTAIEVLEHLTDPLAELRRIRRLLEPGGLFFATTGNARPFSGDLASWRYVVPEVHVAFFEPETLAESLRRSGFAPEFPGFVPGFADVIRFKVLKNLGVRRRGGWERLVPWGLAARLVDRRYEVTAHPIGRAV